METIKKYYSIKDANTHRTMIDNEQTIDSGNLYTRASTVVFAGVGAVLTASHFFFKLPDPYERSVFSGLWYMVGLCYPILYFWAGVLMRAWKPDPRRWVRIVIFGISILCLYPYLHYPKNYTPFFSIFGFGFLIPPDIIASSKSNRGWLSLLMLLLSVFCYTTLETADYTLFYNQFFGAYPNNMPIEKRELVDAKYLMMTVVIYFAVQFAFSRIAQRMGSLKWFKLVMALPCIFMFIDSVLRLFGHDFHYMVSTSLPHLIIQPVTLYLITIGYRCVREFGEKLWKDITSDEDIHIKQ